MEPELHQADFFYLIAFKEDGSPMSEGEQCWSPAGAGAAWYECWAPEEFFPSVCIQAASPSWGQGTGRMLFIRTPSQHTQRCP